MEEVWKRYGRCIEETYHTYTINTLHNGYVIDFAGRKISCISKYTTLKKIERLLIMGKMDENAGYKIKSYSIHMVVVLSGHWYIFFQNRRGIMSTRNIVPIKQYQSGPE
jgi:hypothetical protein